jgi:hypothetical protein
LSRKPLHFYDTRRITLTKAIDKEEPSSAEPGEKKARAKENIVPPRTRTYRIHKVNE